MTSTASSPVAVAGYTGQNHEHARELQHCKSCGFGSCIQGGAWEHTGSCSFTTHTTLPAISLFIKGTQGSGLGTPGRETAHPVSSQGSRGSDRSGEELPAWQCAPVVQGGEMERSFRAAGGRQSAVS